MLSDDAKLDAFFQKYGEACPDIEASTNFMPQLWERIEGRRGVPFAFQRFARFVVTAGAAACLILAGLNMLPDRHRAATMQSYADALAADDSAEKIYYLEAYRTPSIIPEPD